MGFLRKLFAPRPKTVIVVSGLPRSGTSMLMRMLEAGGVKPLVDHQRVPNQDNPKGYYEFERVKKMPEGDVVWVEQAVGRVVKVIAALLRHLPPSYHYKVLFMRRKMGEILASQKAMLIRRGEDPDAVDDEEMAQLFEKHLAQIYSWMAEQEHISYLDVDYNEMLADPLPQLEQIEHFLERDLDIKAMAAVVDPDLYRQRTTS